MLDNDDSIGDTVGGDSGGSHVTGGHAQRG